jgi:type I restriction-modification system DNA methylase subunit
LNDELGSYIRKDLLGNTKIIPVIRYPESLKPGMGTSFSVMFPIKDIKAGEELCQSIADSKNEVDENEKILSNNILFGEHSINNKVEYLDAIMKKHKEFLLKLASAKSDRKDELVKDKISTLQEELTGKKIFCQFF